MIVSIRHSILKSLFEKGTVAGITRQQKDTLLLWLSAIHAAKDLKDLTIPQVSTIEEQHGSYRLSVYELGIFSFRFADGEMRQLNYHNDQK